MSATIAFANERPAQGFALFIVLWFLVLLAAIGTYLLANARTETALARNVLAAAHAEALADAGVTQAVFNLTDPMSERRWAVDGTEHRLVLPGGEISIWLGDETQKINPNLASAALMTAFFEALGVERNHARQLGAAVAAWVRPPARGAAPGADTKPYEDAGLDYGPPHRPFESMEEMSLVLGMTPEIFAAARPYLSLYAGDDAPLVANASGVVRTAIALAAARDQGEQGPPPSAGMTGPASSVSAHQSEEAPNVVDIRVSAHSTDGGVFVRHAVARLDSESPRGYDVLAWSRESLAP